MRSSILILFFLSIATTYCNSQINYNRSCFTADLALGNGLYGIGSLKIGSEIPIFNHQKIGARFGMGIDISEKIGFGLVVSPYQFKRCDLLVACDLTRIFGSTHLYKNDKGTEPDNLYSFDNTNLVIPSIAFRIPGAKMVTYHLTFGWAFGINPPNIVLISGNGNSENRGNVENKLVGGQRLELGITFRLRKWKDQVAVSH